MICVIFNPTARGEKAQRFHKEIHSLGAQCSLRPTRGPNHAPDLAAQAVAEGFETIVAAGGDGTVNEVLNGLARNPDSLQSARLAVLPLGTINVFAKELGIPSTLPDAWKIITHGRERRIDLPYVEFGPAQNRTRRYFIQLAGAGLDSMALGLVQWELKKKFGPLAYLWASLQSLSKPRPQITLSQPNSPPITAPLIIVGNGRFYGGRWPALPRADMTDGRLDAACLPRINLSVLIRGFWMLWRDRFADFPGAIHVQTERFRLTSASPLPFQLEGDNTGPLPADFSILPRAIRVLAP